MLYFSKCSSRGAAYYRWHTLKKHKILINFFKVYEKKSLDFWSLVCILSMKPLNIIVDMHCKYIFYLIFFTVGAKLLTSVGGLVLKVKSKTAQQVDLCSYHWVFIVLYHHLLWLWYRMLRCYIICNAYM